MKAPELTDWAKSCCTLRSLNPVKWVRRGKQVSIRKESYRATRRGLRVLRIKPKTTSNMSGTSVDEVLVYFTFAFARTLTHWDLLSFVLSRELHSDALFPPSLHSAQPSCSISHTLPKMSLFHLFFVSGDAAGRIDQPSLWFPHAPLARVARTLLAFVFPETHTSFIVPFSVPLLSF